MNATTIIVAALQAGGIIAAALLGMKKIRSDILEVHLSLNSRLDALLKAQHASGIVEGRAQERAETKADET